MHKSECTENTTMGVSTGFEDRPKVAGLTEEQWQERGYDRCEAAPSVTGRLGHPWTRTLVHGLLVGAISVGVNPDLHAAQLIDTDADWYLAAPTYSPVASLGVSCCIEGEFAALGAPQESLIPGVNVGEGAVFVWRRESDGYRLSQRIDSPDCWSAPSPWPCAFGFDVAMDGSYLAVSSGGGDPYLPAFQGRVHLYEMRGGRWTLDQSLRPLPGPSGVRTGFGILAFDEGVLAVGASTFVRPGVQEFGSVFLFERGVGGWQLEQQLFPPVDTTGDAGDGFGLSLSLDQGLLVVGEGGDRGRIHAYRDSPSGWAHEFSSYRPGQPPFSARFGHAVAADGRLDRIAVADTDNGGDVFVFERDQASGAWSHVARFLSTGVGAESRYGHCLGLEGDLLAVGAPHATLAMGRPGMVELIRRGTAGWAKEMRLTSDPGAGSLFGEFGYSVALADDRIVIGNRGWHTSAGSPGQGFIWELSRGVEECAMGVTEVSLNVCFDSGQEAVFTASASGMLLPGTGVFVGGTAAPPMPFGSGALCIGRPMRLSPPISFSFGQQAVIARLEHPWPHSGTSFGVQFVYSTPGGVFPGGASVARILD